MNDDCNCVEDGYEYYPCGCCCPSCCTCSNDDGGEQE